MTARGTRSECRLLAAPLAASTEEVSAWPQWTYTGSTVFSLVRGRRLVLVPCVPAWGPRPRRVPGTSMLDCLSLTFHLCMCYLVTLVHSEQYKCCPQNLSSAASLGSAFNV